MGVLTKVVRPLTPKMVEYIPFELVRLHSAARPEMVSATRQLFDTSCGDWGRNTASKIVDSPQGSSHVLYSIVQACPDGNRLSNRC